jgi:hypothetical protein
MELKGFINRYYAIESELSKYSNVDRKQLTKYELNNLKNYINQLKQLKDTIEKNINQTRAITPKKKELKKKE